MWACQTIRPIGVSHWWVDLLRRGDDGDRIFDSRRNPVLRHHQLVAIALTCSDFSAPSSNSFNSPRIRRKLKNRFLCEEVVPILTNDQLCRMYACMAARTHHTA